MFSSSDFICNQNKRQPVLQRHAAPIKSKSLRVTAKRAMDAQEEDETAEGENGIGQEEEKEGWIKR